MIASASGRWWAAGGLGDKPACHADLLIQGVADAEDPTVTRKRNVARLKRLGQAFGDKSGPTALKGILVDGGPGARPSKDKLGVLAELLRRRPETAVRVCR